MPLTQEMDCKIIVIELKAII